MIIVVGNEKGGVGKSLISFNLAAYLAANGETVCLIDGDTQKTVSNWAGSSAERGRQTPFVVVEQTVNPASAASQLDKTYGVVIVDMGARDYSKFKDLAACADLFIAPTRVGQGDLESLVSLSHAMKSFSLQRATPLPFVAVLNAVSSPREAEDAKAALQQSLAYGQVINTFLKDRIVWREAHRDSTSVFDLKPRSRAEAAINDFEAVLTEVLDIYKQATQPASTTQA